ncbi:ABC transporter ATP-binding protein [Ideonella sp. BN130291]|uniref:ABC transporter ATP-binding protein n=1 Tax=Ideonella sp. BN130291 TaxID=3112940 RepID=UPI002E255311|nr:sn-glycerol-3-phosphate ABC transporter ATP-binding protein UgpC [Ideonella sp. BN130291]
MAQLRLAGLAKRYDNGAHAVHEVNLDVEDGEFMVLVGPSGCGKSTTLRMVAGLEDPTEGRIFIGGQDVTDRAPAQRGVAMVFQSYALYPHMTVAQNMGFGLKMAGQSREQVEQAVRHAAQTLQLEALLQRKPRELSGGQRQRVAIGRAIVRQPQVFLFDEPLSNLDAALRTQMRVELSRLHERLRATIVYVTHDQVEAMTLGQRIAVFNQGRIEQVGTPMDLYAQPANRFVAGFLGSPRMNFLPVRVLPDGEGGWQLDAGLAGRLAWRAHGVRDPLSGAAVGVRPEHLQVMAVDDPQALQAQVELVEHLGDVVLVHCRLPGVEDPVTVKSPPERAAQLSRHEAVGLRPQTEHLLVFDAQGANLGR